MSSFPIQHLLSRLNPKLSVKEVATGVHVDGGGTVHWGLVYLNGEPPSKKKVETALREAGFDFVHNVLTQAAFVWTDHTNGENEVSGDGFPFTPPWPRTTIDWHRQITRRMPPL